MLSRATTKLSAVSAFRHAGKKTEEQKLQEKMAILTKEDILAFPRQTLEKYCAILRIINPKSRKQDLQEALMKQARTLRHHAQRKAKAKSSSKKRAIFVAYPGQRIPHPYPGSRGCNIAWNSTLAADVRSAAMQGQVERLRVLLNGLSVNDRAKIVNAGGGEEHAPGDNALHYACWKKQTQTVEWLLKHCNANLNQVGRGGMNSLHWAVKGGSVRLVSWLLELGANSEHRNDSGLTPLDMCTQLLTDAQEQDRLEAEDADLRGVDFDEDSGHRKTAEMLQDMKNILEKRQQGRALENSASSIDKPQTLLKIEDKTIETNNTSLLDRTLDVVDGATCSTKGDPKHDTLPQLVIQNKGQLKNTGDVPAIRK